MFSILCLCYLCAFSPCECAPVYVVNKCVVNRRLLFTVVFGWFSDKVFFAGFFFVVFLLCDFLPGFPLRAVLSSLSAENQSQQLNSLADNTLTINGRPISWSYHHQIQCCQFLQQSWRLTDHKLQARTAATESQTSNEYALS